MMNMKLLGLVAGMAVIAGCATPVYKNVFKEAESYNTKVFPVPQSALFSAVTRAVLSKNFIIEKEESDKAFILARRSFQQGKRTTALVMQAKMVPMAESKTTLYLNGIQTTEVYFVADRTRFFLFLIPLPGGGGKQVSQIKEGEKVIEDKAFYQDFFALVDNEIKLVNDSLAEKKE